MAVNSIEAEFGGCVIECLRLETAYFPQNKNICQTINFCSFALQFTLNCHKYVVEVAL